MSNQAAFLIAVVYVSVCGASAALALSGSPWKGFSLVLLVILATKIKGD